MSFEQTIQLKKQTIVNTINFPSSNYSSMSPDGKYRYVMEVDADQENNLTTGKVYISSDYGETYTQKLYLETDTQYQYIPYIYSNKNFIICNNFYLGSYPTQTISISMDYGETWNTINPNILDINWCGAISENGQIINLGDSIDVNKISFDGGNTFNAPSTYYDHNGYAYDKYPQNIRNINSISMSYNGEFQVAVSNSDQFIYTTSNYGFTWTNHNSLSGIDFKSTASSYTGEYQTVVSSTNGIYISSSFGALWDNVNIIKNFSCVHINEFGDIQIAGTFGDYIYLSKDFGNTWNAVSGLGIKNWISVSINNDGNQIIASSDDGYLYQYNILSNDIQSLIPFELTIDPSTIQSTNKISRIDYDFGDGSTHFEKYTLEKDPLSSIQIHNYFFNDAFNKNLTLNVTAYQFGLSSTINFSYNLFLSTPNLLDFDNNGYFDEIHLVGSRMFGVNNDLVYIFETVNPNYIIPVHVNWSKRPETKVQPIPAALPIRSYKMLSPFEDETATSADLGTKIESSQNSNIENGIPIIFQTGKEKYDQPPTISRSYP